MGPVRTPAVLARTKAHIADAVDKGARVVLGGGADGQMHEPTIIDGVTSDMRIAQEETFGPVAPIIAFETVDEAIRIANETEFGLTAAVFTNDLEDRLDDGRGARARHGAHQRDHELLGSDGRRSAARRSRAPAASWAATSSTRCRRRSRSRGSSDSPRMQALSAVPELVQAVVVDAEVVRDLVQHRDADLLGELGRVVRRSRRPAARGRGGCGPARPARRHRGRGGRRRRRCRRCPARRRPPPRTGRSRSSAPRRPTAAARGRAASAICSNSAGVTVREPTGILERATGCSAAW